MPWAVMATSKTGATLALQRGFPSEDDALGFPVVGAHWERIWVEEYTQEPRKASYKPPGGRAEDPDDATAPFPWRMQRIAGRDYVLDAKGRKILWVVGPDARRKTIFDLLLSLGKQKAEAA